MELINIKQRNLYGISQFTFFTNRSDIVALEYFDITDEDIEMGLAYVKQLAKKRFRRKAMRYHPDMPTLRGREKTGASFIITKRRYETIKRMTILPCPPHKLHQVLDLTREYGVYTEEQLIQEWFVDGGAFHWAKN